MMAAPVKGLAGRSGMSTFGSYEVLEELHRTPFGYVCSARRAGAGGNGHHGEFVIKVFEAPDTDGDGLPGPILQGTDHFVGRARVQQKLTLQRSLHWAQIHELGDSGDSPFYVTDYYPRSAQKLILGRVNLGPAALHEIIDSVVRGLRELRQVCNQPHGCLKPTNVLIGGAGEVSGAKIVLTDPLCGAPGETEHGGDLHALGALIYQLVLHRPFHTTAWPIAESEEWESLGKFANGWRELCNDLLNPDPSKRPDATAIDRHLQSLQTHGISVKAARKVPVKSIVSCVILLVLLAAGGGSFLYCRQAGAYARVHQARSKWIDALWNNKTRLNQYASLGGPIITQSDWDALQLPERPRSASDFSLSAIKRSQSAEVTTNQVHRRLLDIYDQSAGPLRDLRQSYEREGYAQAAGYLASILSTPAPDNARLISAIDERIALGEKLKASRPGMSTATASILDGLAGSEDRDLRAFAGALRAEFRKQCVLNADGWKGTPQLDQLARQIASVRNWPNGYDAERLGREEKIDPGHVQLEDVKRWLATVNQYARVGPTDAQRAEQAKLAEQLAGTSDQIRKDLLRYVAGDSPQVQKLDQDRAGIQKQIDQLGSGGFVRKDLPAAFDAPAKKIEEQIASLPSRHQYRPTDLASWFAQAQGQHFKTSAAREVWSRRMKGCTADNIDAAWKAQTLALAKTLTDLETKTFVVPATLQAEPWVTPATNKAQESAARAISHIAPGATGISAAQLASIKDEFTAWCDEAAKLAQEHALLQRTMINASVIEQHDAHWSAERDRTFWATEVEAGPFEQIMTPQLDRIASIRGILSESSPEKLLAALAAAKRPEVTLVAWGRLGVLEKQEFPGPLTATGVDAWSNLLTGVSSAAEKLPAAGHEDVEKQVARSGERMWHTALSSDSPELLEAATAAAAKLHLTPDQTALSSLQRFDFALAEAIRTNHADNLATQIAALPDWDRSALQQLAGHGDVVEATLKNRSYLWPAGEDERKNKWQNPHINQADQLARAKALIADHQPQGARAALEGLSGPEIDQVRNEIEQLEATASAHFRKARSYSIKANYSMALREFRDAADDGNVDAMMQLGQMYHTGIEGAQRNPRLALYYYRLAATRGTAEEMAKVANEVNSPELAPWFKTAAHDGNVDALAVLAQIAIQKHDPEQASGMLMQADEHDPEKKERHLGSLMRQLASLYEQAGRDPEARRWYKAAADWGDTDAQAWLRRG